MPGGPVKQKRPMDEVGSKDDTKTWKYMCVRGDVHKRLDEQRRRRAEKIGFKLSWTKFFALLADDLEKHDK